MSGPTGWRKQQDLIERMSADLKISREEVRQLTLKCVRAELDKTATTRWLKTVLARMPALTGSLVQRFTPKEIREAAKRDIQMLPVGDDLTLELVEPSALDVAEGKGEPLKLVAQERPAGGSLPSEPGTVDASAAPDSSPQSKTDALALVAANVPQSGMIQDG